jgi:hypothetical protein
MKTAPVGVVIELDGGRDLRPVVLTGGALLRLPARSASVLIPDRIHIASMMRVVEQQPSWIALRGCSVSCVPAPSREANVQQVARDAPSPTRGEGRDE